MSFVEEHATWDARQWHLDRFDFTVKPTEPSPSSILQTGLNFLSSLGTSSTPKPPMICQADLCNQDVSTMKDYNTRYKICETHLRAKSVIKDGIPQRFCQQCGKFQPIDEFEGDKKSCRSRLDKHNARRRRLREMQHMLKTTGKIDQAVIQAKYGITEEELAPKIKKMHKKFKTDVNSLLAPAAQQQHQQQQQQQQFGYRDLHILPVPPYLPPTSQMTAVQVPSSKASLPTTTTTNNNNASGMDMPVSLHVDIPHIDIDLLNDEFLDSILGPLPTTGTTCAVDGDPSGSGSDHGSVEDFSRMSVCLDESPHPALTTTSLTSPGNNAATHSVIENASSSFLPVDPSIIMDLDDMGMLEEFTKELGVTANTAAYAAANATVDPGKGVLHAGASLQSMMMKMMPQHAHRAVSFPFTPVPSHQGYVPSTLPYMVPSRFSNSSTAAAAAAALRPSTDSVDTLCHNDLYYHTCDTVDAAAATNRIAINNETAATAQHSHDKESSRDIPSPTSTIEEALDLLSYDPHRVTYVPEENLVRCSIKLFECTPADLPPLVKESLVDMLRKDTLEGFIRPGCVHLQANALLNEEERRALEVDGIREAAERFLQRWHYITEGEDDDGDGDARAETAAESTTIPREMKTRKGNMVLQLGDKLAVIHNGRVSRIISLSRAGNLLPSVAAIRPLAVPASRDAQPRRSGIFKASNATATVNHVDFQLWGFNFDRERDTVLVRSRGQHLTAHILDITADPSWNGMQRMDIRLQGPLHPGAIQVEVMRGCFASAARTTVVAPSTEVLREVRSLESAESANHQEVDTLLYEIGALLEGIPTAMADRAPICSAKAAQRLLPFFVQRSWSRLTIEHALPACLEEGTATASEVIAAADVIAVGTTGMPLLQLAVRSKNADMVVGLLGWAEQHGHKLRSTTPGRRGLTALHLSALIADDDGKMAKLLTAGCPDAVWGWHGATDEDGCSAMDFAERYGTAECIRSVIFENEQRSRTEAKPSKFGVESTLTSSHEAGSSSSSSYGKGKNASKGVALERLPSETDDVALAKAAIKGRALQRDAAMSPLLSFASPALEAKFASWYHSGQVPVDFAFAFIALLSQAAWIARWSLSDSLILGVVMIASMLFNVAIIALIKMKSGMYIKHRESLCMMSLFAHRIAQMMVTAMPAVGTLYSSTYNPTVALLESSSFAQVALLSFGVKGRFSRHMPLLGAMLAMSAWIDPLICGRAFAGVDSGTCMVGLFGFQAVACFVLPAAYVYMNERYLRRTFLETAIA